MPLLLTFRRKPVDRMRPVPDGYQLILDRSKSGRQEILIVSHDEWSKDGHVEYVSLKRKHSSSTYTRRGDVHGSSFAFVIDSEIWSREGTLEVRTVTDLKLYDVGPVTFPAYAGASVGLGDRADRPADLVRAHATYDAACCPMPKTFSKKSCGPGVALFGIRLVNENAGDISPETTIKLADVICGKNKTHATKQISFFMVSTLSQNRWKSRQDLQYIGRLHLKTQAFGAPPRNSKIVAEAGGHQGVQALDRRLRGTKNHGAILAA